VLHGVDDVWRGPLRLLLRHTAFRPVKRVAAGEPPIRALFARAQIDFPREMAAASFDHETPTALGLVRAHR
jgi:hypothetical protein